MPLNHQRSRCQIRQMHWLKMPQNAGELGRFMSVARVAAGGGVAVLAALAAAAWQAEQADRALLRSLTLTGGAAASAQRWFTTDIPGHQHP